MAGIWMLLYLCSLIGLGAASHFRGALIQWRPVNAEQFDGRIEITHRIAWRRSSGHYCDQSTIASQSLIGGGSLVCQSGCSGTVGSMAYHCTDFSVTEDWTSGERSYEQTIGTVSYFEASFSGGCWINGLVSGGCGWAVRVKGGLTTRADTGKINTSPVSATSPIVRLKHGCSHTIRIPAEDADGDDIRCRWAQSNLGECSGVCQVFPATLDETQCTLYYEATGSTGYYAVALQIEDFATPTSTTPLSSVPLQFLVFVFTTNAPCASRPEFVPPTRADGSCIGVPFNTIYDEPIIAQSGGEGISITEIVTVSPSGVHKSELAPYDGGVGQWFVNIRWMPTVEQYGPNILCFTAVDSVGLTSPQRCITLLAGVEAPTLVPGSMTPTGEIFSSHTQWSLRFDREFHRPAQSRFIRIFEEDGSKVVEIDVASAASPVVYPSSNLNHELTFTTSYTFTENRRYYVLLDPGVAVGPSFCGQGLESPAVLDPNVWVVHISDVDECADNTDNCNANAQCTNTDGGFTCMCNSGFTGDGVTCSDVNECSLNMDNCHTNAQCTNTFGSFTCQCNNGYTGNGVSCSDVNECSLNMDNCHTNAQCTNTIGSFTCHCNSGYTGNGVSCLDVDECADNTDNCDANAQCTNTDGGFTCMCNSGFTGDGVTCSDIDECSLNMDNCHTNAQCTNTVGSFTCQCNSGYTGNGVSCSDVDECTLNLDNCNAYAQCANTDGGFTCMCNSGFTGDGVTCSECTHGSIRLIGGTSIMEGRVEVCVNGVWGTVCDDFWSATDANVACRQLDFSNSDAVALYNAYFGQGIRPVHLDDVGCSGSETRLIDCSFDSDTADCSHSDDASVRCQPQCSNGSVRLIGGTYSFEGRVEVCVNGLWGTVCDDGWSTTDASVACKQLGYSTEDVVSYIGAWFGQGTLNLPIVLDDVGCSGFELRLVDCYYDNNTGDCSHSEDASIRCHSPPVQPVIGSPLTNIVGGGAFRYYIFTFPSSGLTITLSIGQGTLICYASDRIESPNEDRGYDWKIETDRYADVFLNPASLGRPAGSSVYVSLQGIQATNTFTLGTTFGDTSTTDITIGNPTGDSVSSGQFKYFELPFPNEGVTIRLEVQQGTVICYASDRIRNPDENDYDWRIETDEYIDTFLDPSTLGRPAGNYVFVSLQGVQNINNFTLDTTSGDTSISEVMITSPVTDTLDMEEFEYYEFPFPAEGITLKLEVQQGYIVCYASDRVRNPGESDYDWRIETDRYSDAFIDPSILDRPAGDSLYVALNGTQPNNTFTLDSTTEDTSTTVVIVGTPDSGTVTSGRFKYYELPFPNEGVTIRLEVQQGTVICYASDRIRNPDENDYDWRIETDEYIDTFLDPSTLGRPAGNYVFVSLQGVQNINNFTLDTTSGDTSISEVMITSPVTDTLDMEEFEYYELPFPAEGITLKLEVQQGYIVCYASDRVRNPGESDYDWRIETDRYSDAFIDPSALDRPAGDSLYVALKGTQLNNSFTLDSTTEDTSTTVVIVGTPESAIVDSGRFKYYELPFLNEGITITLYVQQGLLICYASDLVRNPSEDQYIWKVETDRYVDVYLDPTTLLRPAEAYVYVSLMGTHGTNSFTINSTSSDTSTKVPNVPPDVQVATVAATSATFTWQAPIPPVNNPLSVIVSYQLILTEERYGLPDVVINVTNTSYTFSGLEEFNTYSCEVAATNGLGRGSFSSSVNLTTLEAAPSAPPQALSGFAHSSTLINLTWLPPPEIDINGEIQYYLVEITELHTGQLLTIPTTDTPILVGPLHPYFIYECRVAAFTVATGPFSATIHVVAGEIPPTAPPTNLTVVAVTAQTFTLSWSPPPFEMQNGLIRQYVIVVTGMESGHTSQTTSNTTEVTVRNLQPFTTYTCKVAAETVGIGPYTSPITVQLLEDAPSAPPQIRNGNAINSTSIHLVWDPPPTQYHNGIIREYAISLTELETANVSVFRSTSTAVVISSLHPYYTYQCAVSAITVTAGPFSNNITLQTFPAAPSAPPQDISAISTSPQSVYLSWNPPLPEDRNGEIVRYIINITHFETGETFQLSSEITGLTVGSLRPYTIYICVIAAETVVGVGPFSTTYVIMTVEDVPSEPENTNVVTIGGSPTELLVTWQPPTIPNGVILSYTVYCEQTFDSSGSGDGTEVLLTPPEYLNITETTIAVASANQSEVIVTGLTPYTVYECHVTANTSFGEGNPSIVHSARTDESAPGDPPRNVEATVVNSTAILLSWMKPLFPYGIIISYAISYNTSELSTTVVSDASNGESYLLTRLDEYTIYQFELYASTRIGSGPVASVVTRTAQSNPAAAPTDVYSIVTGSRTAAVTWMPPPAEDQNGPITYYLLLISDLRLNTSDKVSNTTVTSYNLTNLEEFNNYSCRITAATVVGIGPYSSPIHFVTFQDIPAAAPLSFFGFAESPTIITLMWEPPSPIDINGVIQYYLVKIREMETGRFWTVTVDDQDLRFASLHPYYNYECRVAVHTIGTGPYTDTITVQTNETAPTGFPPPPSVTAVSSTTFTLAWEPPPLEQTNGIIRNYVITITEIETGRVLTVVSNNTQVTVENLHPFYTYACRVAAETIGIGPYSNQIMVQLDEEAPTAAPVNPSAYAADSMTIVFSWSPLPPEHRNGIIRHYVITVTEVDTNYTFIAVAAGTETIFHSLHPSYAYRFTVAAVTIASGPSSPPVIVQTLEDAPSAPPVSIAVSATSFDTISLMWEPPPKQEQNGIIMGYVVTVTTLGNGESFQLFSSNNTITLDSLRPYTTYICVVAAQTSAGIGPVSIGIQVRTNESFPSAPPEDVSVSPLSSTSISLTWSPPPVNSQNGIIGEYRINITEVDTGRVILLNSTTTSLTVPALHPYYTYLCSIAASTIASGPFTEVIIVTTPENVPSGYPQSFEAEATSSQSAVISWEPPLPSEQNGVITGYTVNVIAVETGEMFQLFSEETSLTVDTLAPFTTYFCVIAASTSIGTGPFSTVLTLRTPEDVPTSPPVNPMGIVISSRTVVLRWLPPPSQERNGILREYHIEVIEVETGRTLEFNSTTTSITISSLHPFYSYEWEVSAFTVGVGPYTNTSVVRTPEDVPSSPPRNITGQPLSSESISLIWDPPPAEDHNGVIIGYVISITTVSTGEILQLFSAVPSLTISLLQPFTTYSCIIAANTSVGSGPFSGVVSVVTEEIAPGSHPSNTSGTALNSTHIYLTWDPPEDANGVIREYRINVTELETGSVLYFTSEIAEIEIGPLHPFYTYNCSIVAVTIDAGPYSTIITIRTQEDAPSSSPEHFQATVTGSRSIYFEWEPPPPAEQNGIVRQYTVTMLEVETGEAIITVSSTNSLTVSTLKPYTTYLCSIVAETIAAGPSSQILRIQTQEDVPEEAPLELMVYSETSTTLQLSWKPPSPEHQNGIIRQYLINITELQTERLLQLVAEDTNVTVSSLHPFYTYRCSVAAETIGLGPFTNPVFIEMPEDVPSSPPFELSASLINSNSFLLSWREPLPEDQNGIIRHYLINVIEENTGIEFQINMISVATEILLEFLHPFYSYTCAVAAVTVGAGPYSNPITVVIPAAPPSGAPVNLESALGTSNSLTVSWDPPVIENQNGNVTGYLINVTSAHTGETRELQSTTASIIIDSLLPYTTYLIAVAAQTSAGVGPYTEISVMTLEDAPAAPPALVTHSEVTSTSVTLAWAPPPTDQHNGVIRHYLVFVIEEGTGRNFTLTSFHAELSVSELHPFYNYHFAVAAFTVAAGPYTQQYTVRTEEDVPSAPPRNVEAVPEDSKTLSLTWEPPAPEHQNGIIINYWINVTVAENGESFQLTVETTSVVMEELHPYYTYNYIITAVTTGPGPFSEVYRVQMPQDVPSTSPQNPVGEAVSSTTISIMWEPLEPEGQNGVIISYSISILEIPTSTILDYEQEGHHTELVVDALHPYYEYNCSIAAATEIGVGPLSASFIVRTHEDVPTAPPQNVVAITENSTTIYLLWEPPPAEYQNGLIEEYLITITAEETREQFQLTSTPSALAVTQLHPYYTYSFGIAALTVGAGPFSQPVRNQTLEDIPSAPPQNVAGVAVSSSSIRLSWAAPPSEHQNGVIRSYIITITELDTGMIMEYETHGNDRLLIVNSLHPFYTYHCAVTAYTLGLGPSAFVEVQTPPEVPTDAPQNISVSALNATAAQLTWEPPPPEHRNGIIEEYFITVTGIDTNEIFQVTTNETTITFAGLHPFYTYTFSIAAQTTGLGLYSVPVPLQMPEAAPGAPVQNVTVSVESLTSVTISWLPPPIYQWNGIITKYNVVYEILGPVQDENENSALQPYLMYVTSIPQPGSSLTNNPDPRLATVPVQPETALLENLEEYYLYQFTVHAQNSAGESTTSNSVTQEMPEGAPSGAPTDFQAQTLSSTSLQITWNPPEALEQNGLITGYEILLVDGRNGTTRLYSINIGTLSFQIEGLEKYTDFSVAIAARTSQGTGPYSAALTVRTLEDVPGAPKDGTIEILNITAVSLSWNQTDKPNGVVLDYQVIYYGTNVGSEELKIEDGPHIISVPAILMHSSITITGLEPGFTYVFKVRGRTRIGYGSNFTITTELPVVVTDTSAEQTSDKASISGAVAAISVVATIGWAMLVVLVVTVVCYRKRRSKKMKLSGSLHRGSANHDRVLLQSFTQSNLYETVDVIENQLVAGEEKSTCAAEDSHTPEKPQLASLENDETETSFL